jgi:hypothetical protein
MKDDAEEEAGALAENHRIHPGSILGAPKTAEARP